MILIFKKKYTIITREYIGKIVSEEINEYTNIIRLSDEELETLWSEYFADHENKQLRDKLIVQYIYLTRYVVGRIKITLPPSFSLEDIASYGVEGLIDAIEKYTPQKGSKFESYALVRIRGNILDNIRYQNWMPRLLKKRINDIKIITEVLRKELGRIPTTAEIGKKLGIGKEKVDEILAQDTTLISIYEKKNTYDDSTEIIDTIQDENQLEPLEKLTDRDTKQELAEALIKLPERERMIIVLYYHENMTLKDIGKTINLSESRACQLHAQAIMKLRALLSSQREEKQKKKNIITHFEKTE